jgi:predicted MFS family arabinose efflux permease
MALIVRTYAAEEVRKRYERVGTFKFAYVLLGMALLLTPVANSLGEFFFFAIVIGIAWGIAVPALERLFRDTTDAHDAAEVERIFLVCRSAAFFVGPIMGGLFFDVAPAVAYVIAALLVLSAAAFELLFPERTKTISETV